MMQLILGKLICPECYINGQEEGSRNQGHQVEADVLPRPSSLPQQVPGRAWGTTGGSEPSSGGQGMSVAAAPRGQPVRRPESGKLRRQSQLLKYSLSKEGSWRGPDSTPTSGSPHSRSLLWGAKFAQGKVWRTGLSPTKARLAPKPPCSAGILSAPVTQLSWAPQAEPSGGPGRHPGTRPASTLWPGREPRRLLKFH